MADDKYEKKVLAFMERIAIALEKIAEVKMRQDGESAIEKLRREAELGKTSTPIVPEDAIPRVREREPASL
jgi:hypothetical protein